LAVNKLAVNMMLIVIPIVAILFFILLSWQHISPHCWTELNASKDTILNSLKKCVNICWSKHDFGSDPTTDDCYVIDLFIKDRSISEKELNNLGNNVKSYLNPVLQKETQYKIKIRYDYSKNEISFVNVGVCGNGILEGNEECDRSECSSYRYGSCGKQQCSDKCFCGVLDCSLSTCNPPGAGDDIDSDWCKYCKLANEANLCNDGKDNDCDGLIDADDTDDCPLIIPVNPCAESIEALFQQKSSCMVGLGNCIVEASERIRIPVEVFIAIQVKEGGWTCSGLQNGFCPEIYGNPPNKLSNNLYSIKGKFNGNSCFWRTQECLSNPTYPIQPPANCVIDCCFQDPSQCGGKYTCRVKAEFRAYDTKCDSVNDFADLISKPGGPYENPYQAFINHQIDLHEFIREVGLIYATSPAWGDGVNRIIDEIQPHLSCSLSAGPNDLNNCPNAYLNQFIDDYNLDNEIMYNSVNSEDFNDIISVDNAVRLTAAVITQESGWRNDALRCEDSYEARWQDYVNSLGCQSYGCDELIDSPQGTYHKVSCSYGLMQLMYPTAWGLGYRGTPEDLFKPENNIPLGVKYLANKIVWCGSVEGGLTGYNTGGSCDPNFHYSQTVMQLYNNWLQCN